jgi:hypothetical protein
MPIINDSGKKLDAQISIDVIDAVYSVTFESRGGDRNTDYIPAFEAVLRRLAKLSALITNAQVVSKEAMRLPENLRCIVPGNYKYPLILSPRTNINLLATRLRAAAAGVGRAAGSKGPGNPTKKVEIQFMLTEVPQNAYQWLEDLLSKPQATKTPAAKKRRSSKGRKN